MTSIRWIIILSLLVAIVTLAVVQVNGLLEDTDNVEAIDAASGNGTDDKCECKCANDQYDDGEDFVVDTDKYGREVILNWNRVRVQVFYEAEDPESIRFFDDELHKLIHDFDEQFNIELIPFGFANITEEGKLECHHGPSECESNRRHACVINYHKRRWNQFKQVGTVRCLMKGTRTEDCYKWSAIGRKRSAKIEKCVRSDESMELMKKYKDKTPKEMDKLPFLAIAGNYTAGQYERCKGFYKLRRCICDHIYHRSIPWSCHDDGRPHDW